MVARHFIYCAKKILKSLKLTFLTKNVNLENEKIINLVALDCHIELLLSSTNPVIKVINKNLVYYVKPFV